MTTLAMNRTLAHGFSETGLLTVENTVTDRDALLSRVLEEPAGDTIRLVFADLLRESDDAADQALGCFVWAGVTAAQFRTDQIIDDPLYYSAHAEIERVVVGGHLYRWLAALGIMSIDLSESSWLWDCTLDRVTIRCDQIAGVFERGMLAELAVPWDLWTATAAAILAHWPLERVDITDRPGLSLAIDRSESNWRLLGRFRVPRRRVPLSGSVIPAAYAPIPFLMEERAEWCTEEMFSSRETMLGSISSASMRLMGDLREAAGHRWPDAPRRRN
jgi:uncharacterized protein (TIGR02996 family)